jgi:16S rRNA (guanine(527)-N(7))-methyltransferase RsmG
VKRKHTLSAQEFSAGITPLSPEPLLPGLLAALYRHYLELVLWNQRLALIGPGTEGEILERHYGEALAALPLLPTGAEYALDIGSGAGFPGLVIAAARPSLKMTLAEVREKKWSFLVTAARKAPLPCRCLNVRVASPLPAGIPESLDLVTVRALKLEPAVLAALTSRLAPGGRILLWVGDRDPELPPGLEPSASLKLAGGQRRRILALRAASPMILESEPS